MTREEVINKLESYKRIMSDLLKTISEAKGVDCFELDTEPFDMAIEFLSTESDKEELAIQYAQGYNDGFVDGLKRNRPKSGEWIRDGSMIECSVCECRMPKELQGVTGAILNLQTEYCPNCGSRMKEAEDEE